jgi:hypothetical protein
MFEMGLVSRETTLGALQRPALARMLNAEQDSQDRARVENFERAPASRGATP